MRISLKTIAAVLVVAPLFGAAAHAQFGIVTLPQNDFTWRWGDVEESVARRFEDFSVNGGESFFRCELTGKLSPGSRMTVNEVRQMENDLQVSMFFIQSAANTMNALDFRRDLDWAELACVKPERNDDPEASAERVERAREKAVQEMLERRERRERREARENR
jgi:hypothetical protein